MNLNTSKTLILACIKAMLPCYVWGKPGIGKSDLIRQIAGLLGYALIDLRASQLSDVDLRGLPSINDGMTVWNAPNCLPNEKLHGKSGILFLDELNQAVPSVQNSCYQLILDRAVGEYRLPDGWIVIAAGNNSTDGGFTQRIASPLANRFGQHIEVSADVDTWVEWANVNGVDPYIVALIRYRPELLEVFDRSAKAYPTPRSWSMLSRLVAVEPDMNIRMQLAENCVGKGAAVEYYAYVGLIGQLPSLQAILADPKGSAVPSNPGVLYAVATGLGRLLAANTIKAAMEYLDRLPVEYAVMSVKDAIRRDGSLTSTREYAQWAIKHQDAFKQ